MTLSSRHIALLVGLLMVIVSFFWFGRAMGTYDILITTGFVIAAISFLLILFKKDTIKSKLSWTCLVILIIGLQRLTEPTLIRLSYRYFIKQHQDSLSFVTGLLKSKKSSSFISPSSELWTRNGYTEIEANQIRDKLSKTGISLIIKDSSKIYYRTWGMLDVSHGVYYFYSGDRPDTTYNNIFGNWYY